MTNKAKKGEKLSAEQICKILHISKRKCAWMLQNGMIPCKDSGKKTRRYTVLRKDLDAYMQIAVPNGRWCGGQRPLCGPAARAEIIV